MSNWGQTAAHTHGRQCLCCVQGHLRKPVRARKKAVRKGAGGTGSRVPHPRKGAGPGHSRVPVCARTHRSDLTCASGSSNRLTVVQIQAPIVFLGTHCVELLLHLTEYGLMKLVPIYML